MNDLNLDDVKQYVEDNIGTFHQKRIDKLDDLELKTILKRKNPYLFKAKNVLIASDSARKRLKTSGARINVVAVNGCCYGRSTKRHEYKKKGDLYKYCGQSFWSYVSNDDNLYKNLIVPIGYKAKEKNDEFLESYSKILNKFTLDFSQSFCFGNGEIDWDKLVEFNSSRR